VTLDHAQMAARDKTATISLFETRATLSRPAPLLGEHTREVCCDLLGLSDAEVRALVEEALLT
jgi:benzylsuccinate CoA-transferase BbsF subunit